jgi:S-methylmethionine-dependent homocysteine/selenocysteine methylase
MDFRERLSDRLPLLLDGALGSELTRRGIETPLPIWSAAAIRSAPAAIAAIHADHVAAGAEVVTAATFRTTRRALARIGAADPAAEARALTTRAIDLARSARPRFVAGSIAPLEDCYEPELVPDEATLDREHAWLVRDLADAGVDLILVETMNTIREATAAARAARATGLPVVVSFVCASDGRADARLLSGERVADAARALLAEEVDALGINCTPVPTLHLPLAAMLCAAGGRVPCAAYGNVGKTDAIQGWTCTADCPPANYAKAAAHWLTQGARLLGGCCGTTAEHVAALRELIAGTMVRDGASRRP